MAAFSISLELTNRDSSPNWRIQSKKRSSHEQSLLSTGGFPSWTNVPPIGVPDQVIKEQLKRGRTIFSQAYATSSGQDPQKSKGGKLVTRLGEQPIKFNEKMHFPRLNNATSSQEQVPRGVKQVRHHPLARLVAGAHAPSFFPASFRASEMMHAFIAGRKPHETERTCRDRGANGKQRRARSSLPGQVSGCV